MNLQSVINLEDLRHLARRKLPRIAFDFIDGGADDEITLRENCRVFDDFTFRPRHAFSGYSPPRNEFTEPKWTAERLFSQRVREG